MMNKNEALKVQGFTALRKPQETTLDCLLVGQDAVCIMGTGSGKSAIFTTFALMQEQLVIVIEPHLALELDQVRLLRERDIAAAAINRRKGASSRTQAGSGGYASPALSDAGDGAEQGGENRPAQDAGRCCRC